MKDSFEKEYYAKVVNLTAEEIVKFDAAWKVFSDFIDTFESERNLEVTRTKI